MSKNTARERSSAESQKQGLQSFAIWGVIIVAVLAFIAVLVLRSQQQESEETVAIPAGGESLPVMSSVQHVPVGDDPGPYNSNPPSSGQMYANQLLAGFYDEDVLEEYGEYPEGFVVHSLEHGYVVFWYNCAPLSSAECNTLKEQIQEVMASVDNFKVIGIAWPDQDSQVVMTSWGRRLVFDVFDTVRAEQYVLLYRNVAPEPGAG